MKIFDKKLPGEIAIALVFVTGAVTYSLGYNMAMKKFNDVVSYNNEKAQMYSKLSELDTLVRQGYIRDIDEGKLSAGICSGYISGLEDIGCKYLDKSEYKECMSKQDTDDNPVEYENINGTGYIKIHSLTHATGSVFSSTVRNFVTDGVTKIICDLRGVSGTDVESVGKCIDLFVNDGDLINKIDKKGNKSVIYRTNKEKINVNLVVMTNKFTSGAPELIVSAVKNLKLGKIVGERTAGNCVEEKIAALSDGSGLIFPSARYVIRDSEIYDGEGVCPDVEISLDENSREKMENGELLKDDDIQFQEAFRSFD